MRQPPGRPAEESAGVGPARPPWGAGVGRGSGDPGPPPRGPRQIRAALWVALSGGVLLIGVLGAGILARPGPLGGPGRTGGPARAGSATSVSGHAEPAGSEGAPVRYTEVPPLGGPHWQDWINCGVYDHPVQNEQAVHSLEHGAIWITYRPDLPAAEIGLLRDVVRQSGYRLLSPYPGLPHPIVVSAWGYQLPLERAADPRLPQFIHQFEQNPQGPEPGAPCSGGVGHPQP